MFSYNRMSISVEFPVVRSFGSSSLLPCSPNRVLYNSLFCFCQKKLKCKWSRAGLRASMSTNENYFVNERENVSDSEFVEVIGIGSRKDALLDFCLDSPLRSSSLRFWNILVNDLSDVRLQQRFLGQDLSPKIVEASLFLQSRSKAIILVASAGYGLDHIAAVEILKTVKSINGFAIAIVLKPFSFEGQRRIDEVKDLVAKLHNQTNVCIDIETDRLLEMDLVTLDEALKTANDAVLLAINAVSVLTSEMHRKLIDIPHDNARTLEVSEVLKILGNYKEAKIGFGAGSHIKASILQAIYDCPFIGASLKELNGMVICIVASSELIDDNDLLGFVHTFRQTMECTREIIVSSVHEPNLESNLLITVLTLDSLKQQALHESSILSILARHFPFVSNLWRRSQPKSTNTHVEDEIENVHLPKVSSSSEPGEMEDIVAVMERFDHSEEAQTEWSNDNNNDSSMSGQSEAELFDPRTEPSNFHNQITEGTPSFQRGPLDGWNLGPGYQTAQEWARERAADPGSTSTLDNLSIFCLPVGVRPLEELKDRTTVFNVSKLLEPKNGDDVKALPLFRDFTSTASTLLKGRTADGQKKQGGLSSRAASMLAERDSPKKWTPVIEMQYRGGVYQGRCQGGLPEGKGRLILVNGSIYDGMWRYGKKSGLGTYYFGNGDVFQGSWRDDVMHGKGWFYFQTGDRWFANFWKGKANGEGRFYSKSGDVCFGHFQDGWRHGHFLCIGVAGERCIEVWDKGVLLSRKQLDSNTVAE
ncbi:protein ACCUMULATION AND REPLICATION OF CHLOROPLASTS 3 isoform X2 [Mangifera indica]|uniref:protein ACCUMULATION AND REPLICATION OF CHLOROPLASTS 3 isoform X2 n=1 Tax=Mangifera indica TaxID=29780 RepID=UPI001CFBA91A|nr:protein ACCUMULATION AND REPLICATION OF CHLOROPLASTS 3 isoform X2 [Mangifera indica]